MKKLTVIIPVYNVEQYVGRCLDSICRQTWGDLEIICINDGSTDKSSEICEGYAKKDNRIKVLYQENAGVAAARNLGLKHASGDHIGFLDPDDWIEPDMYQLMMEHMEGANADMGICGFYKNWDDKEVIMENQPGVSQEPFQGEDIFLYAFKRFSYKGFAGYLWNKIFKRELLLESKDEIWFDETIKVGEDVLFFSLAALRAGKAVYIDKALYHYYQRGDSLCHAGSVEERGGILKTYSLLIPIMEERGMSSQVILYIKRLYVYNASLLVEKAYYEEDSYNMRRMQKEIEKYIEDYEATSEGHCEWNKRMRLLMTDSGRAITYTRNLQDRDRRQAYAHYLTEDVEGSWILYESFFGKGMTGCPYGIFQAFQKRVDFQGHTHIWSVSDQEELDRLAGQFQAMENVRFILRSSLEYTEYLAKSRYLINDNTFFYFFIKREEQIYLNTWHGIPMKKLGYDVPDGIIAQHNSFRNFLMTDYLLAWNKHMGQIFLDAYKLANGYQGKIILEGCPRNDITLQTHRKKMIQKLSQFGVKIEKDKKIILYAPTFRGTNLQEAENDYQKVKSLLLELDQLIISDEYTILYKPHHLIYDQIRKEGVADNCIIPSISDANEILSITDILITDYSSIYFDYLITDRPIIFYVPDEEAYMEYRGLYFPAEGLPGAVCRNIGEVAESIGRADHYESDYGRLHDKFLSWACGLDNGQVSSRVLEIVLDGIKPGNVMCQIQKENKPGILIICGSLYEEEKFLSLQNLLDKWDLEKKDLTVLFDIPKTEKCAGRIMSLDKRIRGLARVAAMVMTKEEEILFEKYMNGEIEYDAVLERIFIRECKRCVPGLVFQEIYVLEDEPFSAGMLMAMKQMDNLQLI